MKQFELRAIQAHAAKLRFVSEGPLGQELRLCERRRQPQQLDAARGDGVV